MIPSEQCKFVEARYKIPAGGDVTSNENAKCQGRKRVHSLDDRKSLRSTLRAEEILSRRRARKASKKPLQRQLSMSRGNAPRLEVRRDPVPELVFANSAPVNASSTRLFFVHTSICCLYYTRRELTLLISFDCNLESLLKHEWHGCYGLEDFWIQR